MTSLEFGRKKADSAGHFLSFEETASEWAPLFFSKKQEVPESQGKVFRSVEFLLNSLVLGRQLHRLQVLLADIRRN